MTASNDVATLVRRRVAQLQAGYATAHRRPSAVADLAELRRAATAPVGSVPTVWELTNVPWVMDDEPWVGDEPTAVEVACHTAMTMYAMHQQSRPEPMHRGPEKGRPGPSLGRAVAQLILKVDNPAQRSDPDRISSLRRRFNALVTASSTPELVHHLRGLVQQLRSASIPLDYGRLADDLQALQDPRRSDGVRRRWARDLAGFRPADDASGAGGSNPATGNSAGDRPDPSGTTRSPDPSPAPSATTNDL